ncbi:PREDICTED: probable inactive ATP-dependent zinc metalloprotease FTSHI 5, chloroplastic [Tarenaya hassleriana]|uniref:probable inactive ATP-dependent zinc metalloprotease FTSHI 5, chloroplastic n=1 Tax=Tarenaya hassleriana TaxID=28532 RepID=UPI00053C735D|nr:PREDICTED: probable inactive ATP-dependent zinc metalloprotease FTSHI 5, chloroplastic [Tarenaya hassleriana]
MGFVSASSITSLLSTQCSPPHLNPSFVGFKPRYRVKTRKSGSRESEKSKKILPVRGSFGPFAFYGVSKGSKHPAGTSNGVSEWPRLLEAGNGFASSSGCGAKSKESVIQFVSKPLVYALFCIAIGFSPIRSFQPPALAISFVSDVIWKNKKETVREKEVVLKRVDHEFSGYTRRLLETVSGLLQSIEKVKRENGDVAEVGMALEAVKEDNEKLQKEIMSGMYRDVKGLRKEKDALMRRAAGIIDEALKVKKESERLLAKGEKERLKKLEERVDIMESQYGKIWEIIDEIDDTILKKETVTLSFGIRELIFIERECEELVKAFNRKMKQKKLESLSKSPATKLSSSEIKRELEDTQRKHLEQLILPNVVELDDSGPLFERDSVDFALRIKQRLEESKKLQKNLQDRIRKRMRKFGEEKLFVVKTPEDEVVKGFPEAEMRWLFGEKEVVVPKAIQLHLHHGWKKWQAEAKADLKRKLLEDADFGKEYIAQKQEQILLARDRVVSKTCYNEDKDRWEMDPMAVPYAVSKKLIESARIRHDYAVMYVALKGDDKEYYVDIKEYEMLFEDFGGFDALYMKMLACGIPTSVHLMWIPFSELSIQQQFLVVTRVVSRVLSGLWKTQIVSTAKHWLLEKIKNINDDIMMVVMFPIIEFIIPYPIRLRLGMAWPEELDQSVGTTWYLQWQSEAELNFKSRDTEDFQWFLWFLVRSFIYGFVLYHVFRFLKRKVPRLLGYGPFRRDPNVRKFWRVNSYFTYRKRRIRQERRAGIDPIKTAFDRMKRVKNPPIPLKDFASIESMREEINEVVAFLHNPKAFQEMGARAPRGVLIVGERGTGKTSLALAIAAEARVPVVNVEAQELEAGLWVGQSAANVRELFQTARDLAPVILFVEDFDLFAGVRGKFIHTKQQDHEAFINQLLVELDGFEKQDGVVLMATTRNHKQIDEALRRPGRMDRVFHLQRPTEMERERILHIAAEKYMDRELIDLVDWRKVAEKTALLRPTELKLVPMALEGSAFRNKFLDTDELLGYVSWFATFSHMVPQWFRKTKVVKTMSKMVVNHLGLSLTKEDLENVVDLMEPYGQISNGIELLNPPLDWTRETKFPHAVWAAGRGLIALLIPNFDLVDNLWLEPCSWQGIGCTKITKATNGGSTSGNAEPRSYLEKKLVFCFGSHIASQMLLPFGEENNLSSSELKQAQEIATSMVLQYGWGPDDSPAVYYANNAVSALSMGNNHEYEMAAKVEKIYDLAYQRAKGMLLKNRRVLEKIAEELLEFELLTRKDLERLLHENGGVSEKEPFFLSETEYIEPLSSSFLDAGNSPEIALLPSSSSS